MEYISMERAVELAVKTGVLQTRQYREDWGGGHVLGIASDEYLAALCNAAIADCLKGVGEVVELPEIDHRRWTEDEIAFTKKYARQAIAPIAARLKRAEDVLRMARDAMVNNGIQVNVYSHDYFKAIAAINQQLGEK